MFDINIFVENFRNQNLDAEVSSREWTRAVLETLVEMGVSQGYEVYPNRDEDESEVLLDCVWYDSQNEPYIYKKMILGAESEWGNMYGKTQNKEDILEDFYKLLDFKCENKVMIYSTYGFGDEYLLALRNEMLKILREYENHIQGERYIFFDFQDEEKSIDCFTVHIKKTGANSDLDIVRINKFKDCWQ